MTTLFSIQSPTFRSIIVPVSLLFVVLGLLNLGLYQWLHTQQVDQVIYTMPYYENFDGDPAGYFGMAGDWEVRDGTLVQLSPTGFDLNRSFQIQIPEDQPYEFETRMRFLSDGRGGGVLFNLQQFNIRQSSHMARMDLDGDQIVVFWGYFDDESNYTGQGSVIPTFLPEITIDTWVTFKVQVTQDVYHLVINDQRVAENIPLVYRGADGVGFTTSNSQVAFDDVRVEAWNPSEQPVVQVPTETPTEDSVDDPTAIPTEVVVVADAGSVVLQDTFDVTGDAPSLWQPFSGDWAFEEGAFAQRATNGFDLSAGNAINQFSNYRYRVVFEHVSGQGAGLLFNMAQFDTLLNTHLVRYVHDANFLMWGFFDDNGFNSQGSLEVAAPETNIHSLEVVSKATTYDIVLDDVVLVSDIPLLQTQGYVGLTASNTYVRFLEIDVTSLDAETVVVSAETPPPADSIESTYDLSIMGGNWETANGVTTQKLDDQTDYIAGLGVFAESFEAGVDIDFSGDVRADEESSDIGGGLVFNMRDRDNQADGYMVRLANAGTEIIWGHYDEFGAFVGQGGIPVDIDPAEKQKFRLSIIVYSDRFDILIDDEAMITDIPLEGSGGWIGLISFRGGVAFSNMSLSLGIGQD